MGESWSAERAQDQRRQAEARLAADASVAATAQAVDGANLLHELQVHQVELELQNEELRQAQRELEESRDRFRILYDQAPFAYLTLAGDGKILAANPTAATLLGVDRAGLLGRALSGFMNRHDADAFYLHRLDVLAEQPTAGCDVGIRRADGATFPVHIDSVRAFGSKGATGPGATWYTALIDISALKRAEEHLQESEAHFREIAERIEDVFYVRDRHGLISYVSPAYKRIWGRPASALIGRESAWLETVDVADRDRVATAWVRMRAGAAVSEIYRIKRPDGATRWVHSRAFPVLGSDGQVDRFVGVVRDITVERKLELELRQAQKMEAIGTLASGVAHNLRNMLQALLLFVDIAETSDDRAHANEAIRRARETGKRGAGLIDQLMVFARKQEREPPLVPINLDAALRDAAVLLKPMVGDGIHLEIEAGAPHAVILSDFVELEQVLLNLASNARDAMPGGGTLTMKTEPAVLNQEVADAHSVAQGSYVKLTVRDTGSGMDDETTARIFEPFFTTKDVDKGTGLGLSTVFGIIRRLGGCIEVASKKGEGTTFTICLPSLEGTLRS
ncbi:MAG TPA: PAS domain S-box protein [Polyangia bacterium]|jgi:PAS domain S-box-containing protein|nr:PAS domain S-box protein [Polyangia bacterium]